MEYSNCVYQMNDPFHSSITQFHSHQYYNNLVKWLNSIKKNIIKSNATAVIEQQDVYSITDDEEQYIKTIFAIQNSKTSITGAPDRTIEQLKEIELLEDDWNDNGARAFSKELINRTLRIVKELPIAPEVFPTAIGAIQIEYHKKDGSYLEFEIYENQINQYMVDNNGAEYEYEMTDNTQAFKEIWQAVVDFYE